VAALWNELARDLRPFMSTRQVRMGGPPFHEAFDLPGGRSLVIFEVSEGLVFPFFLVTFAIQLAGSIRVARQSDSDAYLTIAHYADRLMP
jgi:hypothetical protein